MHEQLKSQTIIYEPLSMEIFLLDVIHFQEKTLPEAIDFNYDLSLNDATCFIDEEHMCESLSIILRNAVESVTTKHKDDNWGIGLTYAKEIISLHKGEIIVNSIINKGTSVRISLPIIR